MSCDLHIHSTCSDGAVPIERLASIAARTGLHAIALSDHDTLCLLYTSDAADEL